MVEHFMAEVQPFGEICDKSGALHESSLQRTVGDEAAIHSSSNRITPQLDKAGEVFEHAPPHHPIVIGIGNFNEPTSMSAATTNALPNNFYAYQIPDLALNNCEKKVLLRKLFAATCINSAKVPLTDLGEVLSNGTSMQKGNASGDEQPSKPDKSSVLNDPVMFCKTYCGKIFKKTPLFPAKARPEFLAQLRECIWTFIGAFVGMLVLALLHWLVLKQLNEGQTSFYFGLMAYSFGASAVLLYDVPESPLAQPRNLVGGHLLSAFVGITFRMFLYQWPYVGGPLSVAIAICVMRLAHATHPPGGATALLASVSTEIPTTASAYLFVLLPILSGSIILLAVAVAVNNCSKNRIYPVHWF